jgi:hypothetical protein
MVFTGNLGAGTTIGLVTHDDGATLRDGWNGTSYATFVGGQAFPSSASTQVYGTGVGGVLTGAFEVIYAEVSGLPADLIVTNISGSPLSTVPLPAALPLFASGLGALGLLGWRRKRKAAALAA